MRTTWKFITKLSEVDELIQYCKDTGYASFDFEANGTAVHENWFFPTVLGISFQPGTGWVVPLAHKDSPFKHKWKKVLRKLAIGIFENPAIVKVAWNALYDGRIFRKYGYRIRGRYFDGMLAKYILNEEKPSDLKSMTEWFLPDFAGYDLQNKPGKKATPEVQRRFWEGVDIMELSEYCAMDCDNAFRLFLHFENKLWEHEMYKFLRNLYMPLVRVISDTILNGVLVDRIYLKNLVDWYQDLIDKKMEDLMNIPEIQDFSEAQIDDRVNAYIEELEEEIDSGGLSDRAIENREEKISRLEAGEATTNKERKLFERVNFASVPQMIALLYESEDGFEFPIYGRTDGGNPSTSEDILLKLKPEDDSGFISALLELRGLQKLFTTYVHSVYHNHLSYKDTIHPSYLLHGTVSGRLSSRNPNFQNIPRSTTAQPIKKMFIAPKDHYFAEFDLSQAELRTAAEMYKDTAMIQIFKEGKNIHVATAALVFGVDYDLLDTARKDNEHPQHIEMVKKHKSAKVLNFTIFYGAGAKKVAGMLTESTGEKHSPQKAQDFIDKWFDAFPQAAKGIENTKKFAKKHGYSLNMFGRKRRLPILLDKANEKYERGKWNEALRQSVNAPIQAMSSDITQWISIMAYVNILEGNLPSYLRLVSTVHDSNEFYIHRKDVHVVSKKILEISSTLPGIKKYLGNELRLVPMKASGEIGINWTHMDRYDPNEDYDKDLDAKWQHYHTTEDLPHIHYET